MKIDELDVVCLKQNKGNLPCGAFGTVVYVHDGGEGFEVEFIKDEKTVALLTLEPTDIEKYMPPPLLSCSIDLDPKAKNAFRTFDERMAA